MEDGSPSNDELEAVQQRLQQLLHALPTGPAGLSDITSTLHARLVTAGEGGKQVRSALLLHTHRLLGGTHHQAALHEASAYELLHLAFLLHDDVIDHDWTRRGRPNLAAQYRADHTGSEAPHIGIGAAIVAGDLVLHLAYQEHATGCALAPAHIADALRDTFTRAVLHTAIGEVADLSDDGTRTTPQRAEAIATAKTTAYTFEGPLQAGAALAEASSSVQTALRRFARAAGLAFQLRNDLDDLLGATSTTATASTTSDLANLRPTLLMALAAQHPDLDAFRTALDPNRVDPDDQAAARWLIDNGAVQACRQRATELSREAEEAASDLPVDLSTLLKALLVSARPPRPVEV